MTTKPIGSDDQIDDENDFAEEEANEERESVAEFLSHFPNDHRFQIRRLEPRKLMVNGIEKNVAGHLGSFHHVPTPDEIAQTWGGGLYEIRVHGPASSGKAGNRIKACRKIEISGDAKYVEPQAAVAAPVVPPAAPIASPISPPIATESPALVERVLNHAFEDKRRSEERYERERQRLSARPPDPVLLQTTLEAIERSQRDQIETLRQQLERRDREMAELRQQMDTSRGRPSAFENPDVLKVVFGRGQEDVSRIAEQHKTELQSERERHQREVETERERHRRDLEQRERELLAERERHQRDLERQQRDVQLERERQQRDLELERERHQREVERHQRELEAATERGERDLAAERRDREQQLAVIERLHRSEVDTLRASQVQLLATKDEHLARLNNEMERLRSSAHPSDALSDLERVGKVVSAVRNFAPTLGGEGGPPEPAGWERVLDHARPLIERVADNLTRPQPVAVPVPVPAAPAPARVSAPTANRAIQPARRVATIAPARSTRRPLSPAAPQKARPVQAHNAAMPTTVSAAPPPASPAVEGQPTIESASPEASIPSSPEPSPPVSLPLPTVSEGLKYLETAFRADRNAVEVSREAAATFPASYLRALVNAGPDLLNNEIEARSPDSLLGTSGGKRYLRELIEALRTDLDAAA